MSIATLLLLMSIAAFLAMAISMIWRRRLRDLPPGLLVHAEARLCCWAFGVQGVILLGLYFLVPL